MELRGLRLRLGLWGALALLAGGCLKPNPDFIEGTEADAAGSDSASGMSVSSTASTTVSTDTQAGCDMEITQELTPIDLGPIMGTGVGSAEGNFTQGADEVWYRFDATAEFTLATLFASVATSLAEPAGVCAFFECSSSVGGISQAYVQCPDAMMVSSPSGLMGCCGDGDVTVQWTCLDAQPTGTVYLRATAPASAGECTPFEAAFSLMGLM